MTPTEFRAAMRPLVMAAHRLKSDAPIERVLDKIERKVASCVSNANTRAKKAVYPRPADAGPCAPGVPCGLRH